MSPVDESSSRSAAAVRLVRAQGVEQRAALGLLLTGRLIHTDAAVDQFLTYARDQHIRLDHVWMAVRDNQPVASALVVPHPGRTAMLFMSPVPNQDLIPTTAAMLRGVCQAQTPQEVSLVQALPEPAQLYEQMALQAAGFEKLSNLVYMERSTGASIATSAQITLPAGLEVRHYDAAARPLFAQAILASYEQTLDCPGLLGLRSIDDIIDGHLTTGEFHPELWSVVVQGTDPAAVMLLNLIGYRQAMELVYLGVSVPWRRHGLARTLVQHALRIAHNWRMPRMVLAVDEQNAPAYRLYRALRFAPEAHKIAMIYKVSAAPRVP